MIKFLPLILIFSSISSKSFTSEPLLLVKEHYSQFIDNQVFNFLSGFLNDPLLLNSKEMVKCLVDYTKFKENTSSLIKLLDDIFEETRSLWKSNVYSNLNHKFKKCDFNKDNSQKLSIYFIDKFRVLFKNFMLNSVFNTSRQVISCFKRESSSQFSANIEEYFLNIQRYVPAYPETFCQLKHLEDFLTKLGNFKSHSEGLNYFYLGKYMFEFIDILKKHKRKCDNYLADKTLLNKYILNIIN
jgi:hypothetical protein